MEMIYRARRGLAAAALLAVLLVLAIAAGSARAAEAGTVVVPVGDWIAAAAEWAGPIVTAAVLWALRQLPGEVVAILRMIRFEQLVERSVDAAIRATAGAAKGRVLDAATGNAVIDEAARLAVASAPRLVEWAGGAASIRAKILARLDIPADVALDRVVTSAGALLVQTRP